MTGSLVGGDAAGLAESSDTDSYDKYFGSSSSGSDGESTGGIAYNNNNSSRRIESIAKDFLEVPQDASVGQLLLRRHFSFAARRAKSAPQDAKEWVAMPSSSEGGVCPCMGLSRQQSWPAPERSLSQRRRISLHRRRQENNDDNSLRRQHPLHVACQQLCDERARTEVEAVIQELVRSYPEACGESDLYGRLPLHEAIAWGASTTTISTIMMAYPEALNARDSSGFLPSQLNARSSRQDKGQVKQVLLLARQAWEQSRREALLRMRVQGKSPGGDKKSVMTLAEALEAEAPAMTPSPRNTKMNADEILSQAQTALEDIYDGNRVLADAVTAMLDEKSKYVSRTNSDVAEMQNLIYSLEDENVDLRRALHHSEIIFHDIGYDASGNPLFVDHSGKTNPMCMMSMDPEPPTVLTRYLETKVGELSEENDELEAQIAELKLKLAEANAKFENIEKAFGSKDYYSDRSGKEMDLATRVEDLEKALSDARAKNQDLQENLASALQATALFRDTKEGESLLSSPQTRTNDSPGLEKQLRLIDESSPNVTPRRNKKTTDRAALSKGNAYFAEQEASLSENGHFDPSTSSDDYDGNDDGVSSYQTGMESFATGKGSIVSKKSTTSWGMLSLVQQPSRKGTKTKWSTPTPLQTLSQENDSKESFESFQTEAFHSSLNDLLMSSGDDDLERMYKSAAEIFQKSKGEGYDGQKSTSVFSRAGKIKKRGRKKKAPRRNSDGGASLAVETKKPMGRRISSTKLLSHTAKLLAAETELVAIIACTEENLTHALDKDLIARMRETTIEQVLALCHASDKAEADDTTANSYPVAEAIINHGLIHETEKKFGITFPANIVYSLRAAAITCLESSSRELEAMKLTKNRLEQELVATLIETSERQLHRELPAEIVVALRAATESFGSLLHEEFDELGNPLSIRLNFRELDRMFEKAQRLLGEPFSQEIIIGLRRASFVLQSRLEGTDFGTSMETSKDEEITTLKASSESEERVEGGSARQSRSTLFESKTDVSLGISAIFPHHEKSTLDKGGDRGVTAGHSQAPSTPYFQKKEQHEEDDDSSVDISVSLRTETTREDPKSQDFDEIIQAAKDVLGRDISPELEEALKLLSQAPQKMNEDSEPSRPPPIRIPSRVPSRVIRGRIASTRIVDDGDNDDDDEIKSTVSRQSETSLNLSAVFNQRGTSDLERKLKNLERLKRVPSTQSQYQSKPRRVSQTTEVSNTMPPLASLSSKTTADSGSSPGRTGHRGVLAANFNNGKDEASALNSAPTKQVVSSLDKAKTLGSDNPKGTAGSQDVSLIRLAQMSGTDDLDQLLRHAATKVEGNASLLASTHHMDNATGQLALETIFSDTEATYGIEVPTEIKDALRAAILSTYDDPENTPFIFIVQCLHDDAVIQNAERHVGKDIPLDLLGAIRSTALPAGVSVEMLRPFDTSVLPSKKYNASVDSMQLSLGLTESSRRSTSTRTAALGNPLPPVTIEALRRFETSTAKKYDSSTGSMAFSLAMTDSSRRSRSTMSTYNRGSGSSSNRGSTLGSRITEIRDGPVSTKKKTTAVIGGASAREVSTSNRLPPGTISKDTSIAPDLVSKNNERVHSGRDPKDQGLVEGTSNHSENSWLKLSVSKSPSMKGRKRRGTKKYRKGTKEAMFERAQKRKEKVAAFMNNLADFGAPSDDLQDLFLKAQETLETPPPAFTSEIKPVDPPHRGSKELQAVLEGSASLGSTESGSTSRHAEPTDIVTSILNPDGSESCIATSPQEAELDMLLAMFAELAGRPLPPEIDIAMRKASRSMDSSLDMVSSVVRLSDQQRFGAELSSEKLDFIYGEAEIFLGREIDEGILDTLMRAAKELFELEEELSTSFQKFSSSYASIISTELSVGNETASKSSTRIDSLVEIAAKSVEDDLDALYKKAYEQAPRATEKSSKNGRGKTVPEADPRKLLPYVSGSGDQNGLDTQHDDNLDEIYKAAYHKAPRTGAVAHEKAQTGGGGGGGGGGGDDDDDDDLGAMYRAAINQVRTNPSSTEKYTIQTHSGVLQTPEKKNASWHAQDQGGIGELPRKNEDEAKGFQSPPKPPYGGEPTYPLAYIQNAADDLSESGRLLSMVSPMTEASHYTTFSNMHNSGDFSKDTGLARKLRKLPSLDDSELDLDYEEDYLNPSSGSDDDSDDSESFDLERESSRSEYSGSLGGQPSEQESGSYVANASITSEELNAIISQAQDEYGMELPQELVEALKTASTGSLNDGESMIQHTATDSDERSRESSDLRGLIEVVRKKLSNSDDEATRSIGKRWEMEEYIAALFKRAQYHYGDFPTEVNEHLRQSFILACSNKGDVVLSNAEVRHLLTELAKDNSSVSSELVTSFLKASRSLSLSSNQTSGYVSEASSEEDGPLGASKHGEVLQPSTVQPGDMSKSVKVKATHRDSSSSVQSSELVGARFARSNSFEYSTELDYSESTFNPGSSHGQSFSLRSSRHSTMSSNVAAIPEENDEHENLQDVEEFISEVEKEYGQPLPHHVLLALKQLSVRTGLSSSSDSSEIRDSRLVSASSLSVDLPPDLAGAIQRASEKKANSSSSDDETMPPLRSFSNISALTGFTGAASFHTNASSEWTTDHESKDVGDDTETQSFASDTDSPLKKPSNPLVADKPTPPMPPPPLPLTDGHESLPSESVSSTSSKNHFGRILLKSVKDIYKRKIPKELSHVLTKSRTLPLANNTDEEMQIILIECEDMSGKRLPADLVLALREASVKARAMPLTSKRSKLIKQSSGSMRSRSSGMPSIQEWEASTVTDIRVFEESRATDFQVDRVPSSFGPLSIPQEIAAEERSSMDVSTLKDSEHTGGTSRKSSSAGTSMNSVKAKRKNSNSTGAVSRAESNNGESSDKATPAVEGEVKDKPEQPEQPEQPEVKRKDSMSGTNHSLNVSAIFNSSSANGSSFGLSMGGSSSPGKGHSSGAFNASTATMLISNRNQLKSKLKQGLPIEAIEDGDEMSESDDHISPIRSSSFISARSTGSSTSTEVTGNNSTSISAATDVSRASTLTSTKLPIGVHAVPPLDGVETDDLSAIFKEAAKRFS